MLLLDLFNKEIKIGDIITIDWAGAVAFGLIHKITLSKTMCRGILSCYVINRYGKKLTFTQNKRLFRFYSYGEISDVSCVIVTDSIPEYLHQEAKDFFKRESERNKKRKIVRGIIKKLRNPNELWKYNILGKEVLSPYISFNDNEEPIVNAYENKTNGYVQFPLTKIKEYHGI